MDTFCIFMKVRIDGVVGYLHVGPVLLCISRFQIVMRMLSYLCKTITVSVWHTSVSMNVTNDGCMIMLLKETSLKLMLF